MIFIMKEAIQLCDSYILNGARVMEFIIYMLFVKLEPLMCRRLDWDLMAY